MGAARIVVPPPRDSHGSRRVSFQGQRTLSVCVRLPLISQAVEKKKKEELGCCARLAGLSLACVYCLPPRGSPRGRGLFICSFWRKGILLAEAVGVVLLLLRQQEDGCDVTDKSGMKAVALRRSAAYTTLRWISWYFLRSGLDAGSRKGRWLFVVYKSAGCEVS